MAAPAWWPTLTVAFQWGYGVGDGWSAAFTDESARVRSISIRTGRDDELQQAQTGTATIVLDNRDGALDPSVNTDVRPNVRVYVNANVGAATPYSATNYGLFSGFIDAITPTWDSAWGETVTIECVDPLALLALYPYTATHAAETSDLRYDTIGLLLRPDYFSLHDITPTTSGGSPQALPAKTYDRTPMLDVLNDLALAEDGIIEVSSLGSSGVELFFVTRYARSTYYSFPYTLTDAPSGTAEIEYESVELDYSNTYVYNDVTVTDDAANLSNAPNTGSSSKYGVRKLDLTLPITDATEVRRRAEWIANQYGDPRLRVKSVTLRPAPLAASSLVPWHVALSTTFFGGIVVEGTRPAGAFSQNCFVEGVAHDIDASGEWTITLSTSPATVSPAAYDLVVAAYAYDVGRFG